VLAVGKWHQPPGMGRAKAREASIPEDLPRGKRSPWGRVRSFIMYLLPTETYEAALTR